jgi:hypothetical protein
MTTTANTGKDATPSGPAGAKRGSVLKIGYEVGGKTIPELVATGAAKYFAIFDALLRGLEFGIPFRYDPFHMVVRLEDGRAVYVRALPPKGMTDNGTYVFRLKAADRPPEREIGVYALVALDIPAIVWIRSCDLRKSVRVTKGEFLDKDRADRAFELCFGGATCPSTAGLQSVPGGNRASDCGGDDTVSDSNGPQLLEGRVGA